MIHLTVAYARNPRWADAAKTMINMDVLFNEHDKAQYPDNPNALGELPFTAHPGDAYVHGRDLFARALAGDFGPIKPYQPPKP